MNFMKPLGIVAVCTCTLLFASCSRTDDRPPETYGSRSATGIVIPVEVSLVRRGSHALVVDGRTQFYLESKSQNLREVEGQTVYITGVLQANIKTDDLPVLAIEQLKPVLGSQTTHTWDIPALNLRVKAPETWGASIDQHTVLFLLAGETVPLLIIDLGTGSVLGRGSPLYVGNRRGVRVTDNASLMQEVQVQEAESVIRLRFVPTGQRTVTRLEEGKVLRAQFERLLSDVAFLSDPKANIIQSGSGSGLPCGGSAGILCPAGYFCDVFDPTDNVGKCKKR